MHFRKKRKYNDKNHKGRLCGACSLCQTLLTAFSRTTNLKLILNGTKLAETWSTSQQVFCLLLNCNIKTASFRVVSAVILKWITSLVLSSIYFEIKTEGWNDCFYHHFTCIWIGNRISHKDIYCVWLETHNVLQFLAPWCNVTMTSSRVIHLGENLPFCLYFNHELNQFCTSYIIQLTADTS